MSELRCGWCGKCDEPVDTLIAGPVYPSVLIPILPDLRCISPLSLLMDGVRHSE
jgi:hypothetical protein